MNTFKIFGLVIWSAVALLIVGVGIWSWKSPKAIGFFAGVEPPKVKDVQKYNRAVACLWFVYAASAGCRLSPHSPEIPTGLNIQ